MATINWPAHIRVESCDYAVQFDVQISTMRNGRVYTYGLPGARWTANLYFGNDTEGGLRPQVEALIVSLEGGANRLSMPHFGRPIPNGTLRGTPTLQNSVAGGAKTISIANANGTLKAGDIIGLPGQIVMVMEDVAPVDNVLTDVPIRPALFSGHTGGTAITWNKPTTLWIPKSSTAGPFPYRTGRFRPGFSIELVESGV